MAQAQKLRLGHYHQFGLFRNVFERVRADYVKKPDDEKLIESAINGMLAGLDPHSSYMDARSFRNMQLQTRGEFGGLGIEVTLEEGVLRVVAPIDGLTALGNTTRAPFGSRANTAIRCSISAASRTLAGVNLAPMPLTSLRNWDPTMSLTGSYPVRRNKLVHRYRAMGQAENPPFWGSCQLPPAADICSAAKQGRYSITSSARADRVGGTSIPSAFAVFRLITNSNLVDCCTGKSAGFVPLRIRTTKSLACRYASVRLVP
jgi:hypothetical protein